MTGCTGVLRELVKSRVPPRSLGVALDARERGAICQSVQSVSWSKQIIRAMPKCSLLVYSNS